MVTDWSIQTRGDACALTGRAFAGGEAFYTLLYRNPQDETLTRRDVSEAAWRDLRADRDAEPPFSFWRTKFTPPASATAAAPETLPKENAEALLRRFLTAGPGGRPAPEHVRTCYILALMLERKRLLRPVPAATPGQQSTTGGSDENDSSGGPGGRLLVYEHARTGEVFLIQDPALRLDDIEEVQREVAELLARPDDGPNSQSAGSSNGSDKSGPA